MLEDFFRLGVCIEIGEGGCGLLLDRLRLWEEILGFAGADSVRSRCAVTLIASVSIEGTGGVGVIELNERAPGLRSLEDESLDLIEAVPLLVGISIDWVSASSSTGTRGAFIGGVSLGGRSDGEPGSGGERMPSSSVVGSPVTGSATSMGLPSASTEGFGACVRGGVFFSVCHIPPRNFWSIVSVNGISS